MPGTQKNRPFFDQKPLSSQQLRQEREEREDRGVAARIEAYEGRLRLLSKVGEWDNAFSFARKGKLLVAENPSLSQRQAEDVVTIISVFWGRGQTNVAGTALDLALAYKGS